MDKDKDQDVYSGRNMTTREDFRTDDGASTSSSDSGGGGAQTTEDDTEKLRAQLSTKVMEVRARLEQVRAYAASKGLPEPAVQDADYLNQDPSTLSPSDLNDLEARMNNIDRDVTGHEAGQVQEQAGAAVGMLAALGAIGGAGALAGALLSGEHQEVSEAVLGTPEINHGIGALGQQQQRGVGNLLDI